jgi:hypothetical protein
MRINLAEQLLAKTLNWTQEEISVERKLLQALGDFKYNDYQQFSHGIRFIESLMRWLKQFETIEEKRIAYRFVKEKLIFISNEQMLHLVSIAFSEKVSPRIILKSAQELKLNPYHVAKIVSSAIYKANLRKTLFIGLSDGSRIDQFRRASQINNEQVSTTYSISDLKSHEMIKELQEKYPDQKFNSVFLIDDFTASGKSYFRGNEKKGKIYKFLRDLFESDKLDGLIDKSSLDIHVLFYIATTYAKDKIESAIKEWQASHSFQFTLSIDAVQLIEENAKDNIVADQTFVDLCQKYFDATDETIINRHYKVGKHLKPHLGFDECALPLVLNHNTPNNSLPLLWLPDDKNFRGLFPRVTRHKE